jgi:hypothetical protein
MGHASLMRPARPLPTVWLVNLPLRLGSNVAAAIIAAKVARGHGTSTSGTHEPTWKAHRGWSIRRICAPYESIVVIVRGNVNGRLVANLKGHDVTPGASAQSQSDRCRRA